MFSSQLQKLSTETCEILQHFFRSEDLDEAFQLVEKGKISLSFFRGTPSRYFVVSGVMRDGSVIGGRVSSKIVNGKRSIQSHCNCSSWTSSLHCVHVASLCIKFYLQGREGRGEREKRSDYSCQANPSSDDDLAWVGENGTIIDSPDLLEGVKEGSRCTWFTCHYLLKDESRVSFPLPIELEGKIHLKLTGIKDKDKGSLEARFLYVTKGGECIEEISILGSLYLFDWVHGQSYNLPPLMTNFLKEIKLYSRDLGINDYLRLTYLLRKNGIVVLVLDDLVLDQVSSNQSSLRVFLQHSGRSRFFNFIVTVNNERDEFISLFDELSIFAFNGGALDTFGKKSNMASFMESFPLANESTHHCLNKFLRYTDEKELWKVQLDSLFSRDIIESYDREKGEVYFCETFIIRQLLASLVRSLGAGSFCSTSFNEKEKKLVLQIRANTLLDNIGHLHKIFSNLGIRIYCNNSEINKWRPQIQLRRQNDKIDWFDIDFKIKKEDWDVIKGMDLKTRQFFDGKKLTLLGEDQRDIIKFLARYTEMAKLKKEVKDEVDKDYYEYQLSFNRAQIFELFELEKMGLGKILSDEDIELCERLRTFKEIPQYEIPENFSNQLRPYQKDAYHWLRFLWENRFGACLADDMGLGKTIQAIGFLQSIKNDIERVLIVCPISILFNWISEFKKFSNYGDDLCLYYGGGRKLDMGKKIILTSYGVIKREAEATFKDMEFDVLVMDEVQNLKNIRSLGAESIRKIKAKFNLCLTGTPLENDITEFYNILDLAVPGVWGRGRLARLDIANQTPQNARRVAQPFVLRRTKDQVLDDLPPKVDDTIFLDFSDQERAKYTKHLLAIKKRIDKIPSSKRYGEIFKGLLELRQLCLWQKYGEILSTKIDFLFKNLDQILIENHQVLIFSQFTTYLNIIQNHLVDRNISFSRIDGSYSIKKRHHNIETFQSGENRVFLISLKAGGQGLNLTAASYVYIMDPWWNPAVENQAIDRVYRIGQKKSVNIYRLIVRDSVEEKVLSLQERKKKLFNDVLGTEEGDCFQGKLSMKDFEVLLS